MSVAMLQPSCDSKAEADTGASSPTSLGQKKCKTLKQLDGTVRKFCWMQTTEGAPLTGNEKLEIQVRVPPAVAKKCDELIRTRKDMPKGSQFPFEHDGVRYVLKFETHNGKDPRRIFRGAPMGKHKGCTAYKVIE